MDAQQSTHATPSQAIAPPPAQAAAPPPPAGAPTAAPVKDDRDHVDKGTNSWRWFSFFIKKKKTHHIYGMLGLEAAQQKYAGKYMPKDQKKVRAINEKITDFVRKFFEKKGLVTFPSNNILTKA